MSRRDPSPTVQHATLPILVSGLVLLASGVLYYLVFRTHLPWPGTTLGLNFLSSAQLRDISGGTYPSFIFTLSLGLIALSVFHEKRYPASLAILGVWKIGLVHEVSMGTFDLRDVVAGTLGASLPLSMLLRRSNDKTRSDGRQRLLSRPEQMKFAALMVASLTMATGTSRVDDGPENCSAVDEAGACLPMTDSTIVTSERFMEIVRGRTLVRLNDDGSRNAESQLMISDTKITGFDANGNIDLDWYWDNSLFCRSGVSGLPDNAMTVELACQRVDLDDNVLGFVDAEGMVVSSWFVE